MNEEIEDFEFYHQDFTTASEWEVFIAHLEEIINQWKASELRGLKEASESSQELWTITKEILQFADATFEFFSYKRAAVPKDNPNEELIPNDFEFASFDPNNYHEHCIINEWFGLDEFYVLSPINGNDVKSESHIRILLSSVKVAITTTSCHIPVFIQVSQKRRKVYLGFYQKDYIRVNFECVHLPHDLPQYQNLVDTTKLFEGKISQKFKKNISPVFGSVQNTYTLNDFGSLIWKQNLRDFESDESRDLQSLLVLPFGITFDPIYALELKATWLQTTNYSTQNYSNNLLKADKWSLLAKASTKPITILSESFNELLSIFGNQSSVRSTLSDFVNSVDNDYDNHNPLNVLTEPKIPTISNVIRRATLQSLGKIKRNSSSAPISEDVLETVLYWLFPDADENHTYSYGNKEDCDANVVFPVAELTKGFKTCKTDSLPYRLAIVMGQALMSYDDIRAFTYIWFEFVQEMRYRWEKSIPIVGVAPGFPDARTCFLHQKLQMLNCCIERKKARETREVQPAASSDAEVFEDVSSSDEEFFDSTDKLEDLEAHLKRHRSIWNRPQGRLGKFENLKLLKTGEPLYIPMTQEPVPKTEDQLEEDTDVLLRLGSDAQGSELRAKMMSASLLSDMESFKAANPEAILEDFIRWYSPRDWIEEEGLDQWGQRKGRLSSRMLIEDNTWVQIWETAKPVAANRQKRLFDDTREAEKVLHFLDSCSLSQLADMLLPVYAHAAICKLAEELSELGNSIPADGERLLQRAAKLVEKVSRDVKVSTKHYEVLVQEITGAEFSIARVRSILQKLNPAEDLDAELGGIVAKLAEGYEVEIREKERSLAGQRMVVLFGEAQARCDEQSDKLEMEDRIESFTREPREKVPGFPAPVTRNFVMRTKLRQPARYSSECLQFMRVIKDNGEVRMMSAATDDIVFF